MLTSPMEAKFQSKLNSPSLNLEKKALSKKVFFSLLLIFVLAIILRLIGLGSEYLWLDEAISMQVIDTDLGKMIREFMKDARPPFYYLLLHFYYGINPEPTIDYFRFLSVIFSLFTLGAIFYYGKRFLNEQISLLAVLIASFSAFQIYYAQEARPYSLIGLLSMVSSLALMFMLFSPVKRWLWVYAVVNFLALLTHYHFFFFLFAHLGFVSYLAISQKKIRLILNWLFSFLISLTGFFLILSNCFMLVGSAALRWLNKPTFVDFLSLFSLPILFQPSTPKIILFLSLMLLLFLAGLLFFFLLTQWRFLSRSFRDGIILQIFVFVIPPVICFFISISLNPYFFYRYFLYLLPAFSILSAVAIFSLKKSLIRFLLIFVLIAPNLYSIIAEIKKQTKDKWQLAFDVIAPHLTEDSIVLCSHYPIYSALVKYTKLKLPYYNYREFLSIYKNLEIRQKKANPDILFIRPQYQVRPDLIQLFFRNLAAEVHQKNIGRLNLALYKSCRLAEYHKKLEQKKKRMEKEFDFFITAESSELDKYFYANEINENLEHFRWSKDNELSFFISPGLSPGRYEIVFDIDTKRPAKVPPPKLSLQLNDIEIVRINDTQERMQIRSFLHLPSGRGKIKITINVNSWRPMDFIPDTKDDRKLGVAFYSLGLKKNRG